MTFLHPALLWALPPVAALLVLNWRRRQQSVPFSSLALLQQFTDTSRLRWRRFPELLRALAILTLLVACAGPQVATTREQRTRQGIAIELLVDTSSSMDMTIASENSQSFTRFEAVQQVLTKFITGDGEALTGRPEDLLGLITFARYADTACPLTPAHDALVDIVQHLEINDRPNEDGTAYGDAVALAAARLKHLDQLAATGAQGAQVKNRVIVLLTDGENNCGRHLPLEATALAKEWGIRLYVISLAGNQFSEKVQHGGTTFTVDEGPSEAEQILARMASETGGIFRSVRNLDALEAVYQEIDTLEKSQISTAGYSSFTPIFWPLAAFALLAICSEAGLRATVLRCAP